jgi:hypothetical protein
MLKGILPPFEMREVILGEYFAELLAGVHSPIARPQAEQSSTEVTETRLDVIAKQREHWRKLHSYSTRKGIVWNPVAAAAFVDRWNDAIPTIGCGCGAHWSTLLAEHPPTLGSAFDCFVWGWRMHNLVNARLHESDGVHPQFSFAEAVSSYKAPKAWLTRFADLPRGKDA